MLSGWLVTLIAVAYLLLLFAVARFADARADAGKSIISANVYALSLAVYCSSWTFYGSVGRAATGGLSFLTIYIGPTLMFLFVGVLLKLLRVSKAQRITSIADFIASRYGKSQLLAGLVTVIAVIGIVPYIALQLKAIAASLDVLLSADGGQGALLGLDSTLWIAAVLALFAILFGTRHLDATERHEGMVAAVVFESVVKLLAFLVVGLFVVYGLYGSLGGLFQRAAAQPELLRLMRLDGTAAGTWMTLILLSGLAMLCLPRQFQILVVENVDETHLRRAVWLFPLYLLLINIFVLPLALGGLLHFGGSRLDSDMFVLTLPLSHGAEMLALLVFIGGLSAATGMIIVESIALSTMVCNDLVMPLLLRSTWFQEQKRQDFSKVVIGIRRAAIALILLLGYLYFRLAGEAYALVGIGLISFAAVAQFAPAMLGGLYWRQGTRAGAITGLLAGFLVWCYTLLLPSFARSGWIGHDFVSQGLFGWPALKAQALFGMSGVDEITHCLWWSLLANAGLYILVSLYSRQSTLEIKQAELFVGGGHTGSPIALASQAQGLASNTDLVALLERFLGTSRAHQQLRNYAHVRHFADWQELPADAHFLAFAEGELAAAVGSASARVLLSSVVHAEMPGFDEVLNILDEATQVRTYSRELEAKQKALELATAELRAANERLRELDRLKDDFISTVSHELRTPLTSIRALSEMMFDDPEIEPADRQRFLGIVLNETERLTRLINQVLDLAKLESGCAEWCSTAVDMGQVIQEAVASLTPLAQERGVSLHMQLAQGAAIVQADPDRLTQVVINLLSNAIKFVPATFGTVNVSLQRLEGWVRVEVADNGPGLTADECSVIFQKFRQGGNTLTGKPQGTGLGLPISRQIVEYFGGKLWVESQPGQGATFIFTTPLPVSEA